MSSKCRCAIAIADRRQMFLNRRSKCQREAQSIAAGRSRGGTSGMSTSCQADAAARSDGQASNVGGPAARLPTVRDVAR